MRDGIRVAIVLCFAVGLAAAQEPHRSDVEETARIELVQLEVTAWPKSGDPAECRDLTAADFEITVDGRMRETYAVDRLATVGTTIEGVPLEPASGAAAAERAEPPLTMVLFFDLWHFNLFYRGFDCPRTQPVAFEKAREMIRESFRPGDRLLIVTFAGWPVVHHGWLRDRAEALAVLDRLEVSPSVLSPRTMHSDENPLVDGLKNLFLALGRYPGRKDVLYLGDDFRFDGIGARMLEIAARAQANEVSLHAIDLLEPCRSTPGPGCNMRFGGLGCTTFRLPLGVAYLAAHGGGRMFDTDDVAEAVRELRRMQGCRYLLAFKKLDRDEKRRRTPTFNVRLARKGLHLFTPTSFQLPGRAPKERDEQDALFLLPHFGNGLMAEAGLWPLRPNGKKNGWRAVMLLRLQRVPGDEWPIDVTEIVVDAAVHKGGKMYGEYQQVVKGDELAALRDGTNSKLLVFPVDDVRAGETTVVARAWAGPTSVAAMVRMTYDIPYPPQAGEARPWSLVDGVARVGKEITLLPSLDGTLQRGGEGMILGFGCPADPAQFAGARLVSFAGDQIKSIAVDWLEPREVESSADPCGWLAGQIDPEIPAGLWRFEPPPGLTADDDDTPPLEFRIAAD